MLLKNIKENKSSISYFIYLFSLGIIFYLLNIYTPLWSDDWHYNLIYNTNIPIKSIKDIFTSQYSHYFICNGRFTPHFIIQYFDGIAGIEWFNIANSIVFVLFIHLITHISAPLKRNNISIATITAFIVFLLPYNFNECFLWMSGACNYMWTATIWMLFHCIFLKDIKNKKVYPLLFLYGIITGWTQEGVILGACAGYFFYFLLNRNKLTPMRTWLISGLYIGTALLVFSPAAYNRAQASGTFSLNIYSYINGLLSLQYARILLFTIITLLIFSFKRGIDFKKFIKENIFFVAAILTLIAFIIIIKNYFYRAFFGFEFFTLIILIKLLSKINYNKTFITIINIAIVTCAIYTIPIAKKNYNEFNNLYQQIEKGNKIIATNEININNEFINRYILKTYTSESSEFYKACDPIFCENKLVAKRFDTPYIIFLPEKFINDIKDKEKNFKEFVIPTKYPFYVKELKNNENPTKATFILEECDFEKLPFYIKPFAHKLDRFTLNKLETTNCNIIELEGKKFFLIRKNYNIDSRVKSITYE